MKIEISIILVNLFFLVAFDKKNLTTTTQIMEIEESEREKEKTNEENRKRGEKQGTSFAIVMLSRPK